jgi:hypothetical protein
MVMGSTGEPQARQRSTSISVSIQAAVNDMQHTAAPNCIAKASSRNFIEWAGGYTKEAAVGSTQSYSNIQNMSHHTTYRMALLCKS